MPPRTPAPGAHHTPPPDPHRRGPTPTPLVRRTETAATRAAHPGSPPTAATWAPWAPTQKEADARLKTEIESALAELNALQKEADHILDTAYTLADQRAAHLQAAAWAQFQRFMDMAEKTWMGIVTPALQHHAEAIGRAHDHYVTALNEAEATHRQMLADADRAKSDGAKISGVA